MRAPEPAVRIVLALALAGYPLAVYFLLERVAPTMLVIIFGVLAALRFLVAPGLSRQTRAIGLTALSVFCVIALLEPDLIVLKFYPVLINLGIAGYALHTLLNPPSAIERLSTMMGMQVEGPAIAYTRRLTMVWIGFFILNAGIAGFTVVATPTSTWAWYNGLISYLLIGLLIVGEYPVRLLYQRRHRPG